MYKVRLYNTRTLEDCYCFRQFVISCLLYKISLLVAFSDHYQSTVIYTDFSGGYMLFLFLDSYSNLTCIIDFSLHCMFCFSYLLQFLTVLFYHNKNSLHIKSVLICFVARILHFSLLATEFEKLHTNIRVIIKPS